MKPLTYKCRPEDVEDGVWTVHLPVLDNWPAAYEVIVLYRDALVPRCRTLLPQSIAIRLSTADLENYRLIIAQPETDYTVVCDETTTTPEDIAKGTLNVDLIFHGSLAAHVRNLIAGEKTASMSFRDDTVIKGDTNG